MRSLVPKLFPELIGDRSFVTRQKVLYFGPPPGDLRFAPPAMPAWIDFGEEMYSIPDIEARGFKISLDHHGAPFDPDTGDRVAGPTIDAVRAYLPGASRRSMMRRSCRRRSASTRTRTTATS